ncbi:hypothetical protein TNCV_1755481 [Trichonephila clavipes]|nr:hypothetical protein TNCV_1755481 [Trichonephila clavipes]
MVTSSSPAYQEFKPSSTEDMPCIGGRCTFQSVEAQCPPGVVVRRGRCQLRHLPHLCIAFASLGTSLTFVSPLLA